MQRAGLAGGAEEQLEAGLWKQKREFVEVETPAVKPVKTVRQRFLAMRVFDVGIVVAGHIVEVVAG